MRTLVISLFAVCTLGLFGCSKSNSCMVGKWETTDYVCENRGTEIGEAVIEGTKEGILLDKYEFDASGSYKCICFYGKILLEGSYKIKGNSLIMTHSKISSRERLQDEFKEVDDSVNEIFTHNGIFSAKESRTTPARYLIREINDTTMILTSDYKMASFDYTNVFFLKKETK